MFRVPSIHENYDKMFSFLRQDTDDNKNYDKKYVLFSLTTRDETNMLLDYQTFKKCIIFTTTWNQCVCS